MFKKILTNKFFIILFVGLLIIIAGIIFITREKSTSKQPVHKIYTRDEHIADLSFPETERFAVKSVFENEYDELKKNIPPGADFTIRFDPNGPLLSVRFPAKNLQEFYDKKQTISLFLIKFNINPCAPPISQAIAWEAQDWTIIKPDPTAQDHSCDELASFYEKLKSANPLVQYLPYAVDGFNIYYKIIDSSNFKTAYTVSINIPARVSSQLKTRQDIFDALQKQENLALDWIRSKGFDPSKLDIRMPELNINQIQFP